ncbi:MAG: hypothetical protein JOZ25_00255 [Actinobacteria bacterium]|nr:hypothetical protein [Actinomycetota bacterium]
MPGPAGPEPVAPAPASEAPGSPQTAPGMSPELSRIDAETPRPQSGPTAPASAHDADAADGPGQTGEEERPAAERRFAPSEPAEAEPSPSELAERGAGRPPAPLGASEPGREPDEGGSRR